jgi:hypothetical protein
MAHPEPYPTGLAFGEKAMQPSLVRLSAGFLLRREGQWRFLCAAATGASTADSAPVALASDGVIRVGTFSGLWAGSPAGCALPSPAGGALDGEYIKDIAEGGPGSLVAVTATSHGDNGVYESLDEGSHWARLGAELSGSFLNSVRVAPGDPSWIYTAGRGPDQLSYVYRSSDRAASWQAARIETGEQERAVLLAVDPLDPQRVFLVLDRKSGPGSDQVMLSTDGGEGFTPVLDVAEFGGFALSADGGTAWVGDRVAGLYRLAQASSARVGPLHSVTCLHSRAGVLFACADNWLDGFAVGSSTDGGEHFAPVMSLQDASAEVACADPLHQTNCQPEWTGWQQDILDGALRMRTATGAAGMPALSPQFPPATTTATKTPRGGCSVGIGIAPGPSLLSVLSALLALAARKRSRRAGWLGRYLRQLRIAPKRQVAQCRFQGELDGSVLRKLARVPVIVFGAGGVDTPRGSEEVVHGEAGHVLEFAGFFGSVESVAELERSSTAVTEQQGEWPRGGDERDDAPIVDHLRDGVCDVENASTAAPGPHQCRRASIGSERSERSDCEAEQVDSVQVAHFEGGVRDGLCCFAQYAVAKEEGALFPAGVARSAHDDTIIVDRRW